MAYSKLHASIVNSSLWMERDQDRLLFITLLAIADRDGVVYGSKAGLARIANIEPALADSAFSRLQEPDPDSSDRMRNPDSEGRRIEEVPGGFKLINFDYYRGLRNDDDRREQNRQAQERWRNKQSGGVSQDKPASARVSQPKPISEAEAEAEAEPSPVRSERTEKAGPPSIGEVRVYWSEKNLRGEPDAFFGWQEEHGWPSKSWKRAAGNWSGKETATRDTEQKPTGGGGSDFAGCYTCRHEWHAGHCKDSCKTCAAA
jgi:hypothetical protein